MNHPLLSSFPHSGRALAVRRFSSLPVRGCAFHPYLRDEIGHLLTRLRDEPLASTAASIPFTTALAAGRSAYPMRGRADEAARSAPKPIRTPPPPLNAPSMSAISRSSTRFTARVLQDA